MKIFKEIKKKNIRILLNKLNLNDSNEDSNFVKIKQNTTKSY